jgi:hypothetical protein
MDFRKYISEKKKSTEAPEETTAVMAFGRFNPPTVGHEKLLQRVHDVAREHGGEAHVVASHSQGTMKDPLPQDKKIGYLRSIANGKVNISGSSKQEPKIFHAATRLHNAGHSHLVVVAGSDRVEQYQRDLNTYNGVKGKDHGYYNFKSIKVISAGQRDPDAEGVEGMSGTKMREHARKGNMSKFKSGLPEVLKPQAKEIADHIRSVNEDYENPYRFDWGTPEGTEYMKKMTPSMKTECGIGEVWSKEKGMCVSIREAYLSGEKYKLNDLVETTTGYAGKIVYRGATYVTIQLENSDTKKIWLKDIKQLQENAPSVPIIRNKMSSSQIPVLLMSKKQIEEKLGTAKISYKELKEMYKERDINFNPSKEVTMGIDKTCDNQTVNGKPVGMVSFKTFMQGEVERIANEYKKDRDSIEKAGVDIRKDASTVRPETD